MEMIQSKITGQIDGELYALPDNITGVIFTNLTSYAGGTDLWGKVKPEHKV